jgi:hypothetical protein
MASPGFILKRPHDFVRLLNLFEYAVEGMFFITILAVINKPPPAANPKIVGFDCSIAPPLGYQLGIGVSPPEFFYWRVEIAQNPNFQIILINFEFRF